MFLEAEPCFTNFHCLPPTQGLEGTTLRTHEELAACLESTSYRALGSPALASYSLPSRGDNSSCPWKTHLHRFQPACLCGTSPFPFVQPFKHWKEPMSEVWQCLVKNYKDFLVVPFSSRALPKGASSHGGGAHVSKPQLRKQLSPPTQHPLRGASRPSLPLTSRGNAVVSKGKIETICTHQGSCYFRFISLHA